MYLLNTMCPGSDGVICCPKWTIVCSGLIPSWELSSSSPHPEMLIIYLCSWVEGNTRSDRQWMDMAKYTLGKG